MSRFTNVIILIVFFAWIIPLGAFLRPEQEKKVCNGKRAICLCTHLVKKQMAKTAGKTFLKNSGHPHQQAHSSPSFGPDFVFVIKSHDFKLAKSRYHQSASIFLNRLFIRPIDHVPKA